LTTSQSAKTTEVVVSATSLRCVANLKIRNQKGVPVVLNAQVFEVPVQKKPTRGGMGLHKHPCLSVSNHPMRKGHLHCIKIAGPLLSLLNCGGPLLKFFILLRPVFQRPAVYRLGAEAVQVLVSGLEDRFAICEVGCLFQQARPPIF
jgi:hypothetical protein